ncbi:4Fe-4S dicluster domain-containing protein [Mycobacterium sp.]|uniref:4Fe-4S dicluster domain-containing protein n=1 Tax=Mycobacterium sp. TaxID=1785 RepID=UPI003D0E38A8
MARNAPRLPYRRGPIRRRLHLVGHRIAEHVAKYVGPVAVSNMGVVSNRPAALFPHRATRFISRLRSPALAWTTPIAPPPEELRTVPGIRRDSVAEQQVYARAPLHDFFVLHRDALTTLGPVASMVLPGIAVAPRLAAATRRLQKHQNDPPAAAPRPAEPARLTRELKTYAAGLGISAVGVTAFDPKFTFAEHVGKAVGEHVVVCVLEQNYDATQRIPAVRSEQAALSTYGELEDRMLALAQWLRGHGWKARPEDFMGESMFIPYAVAAGLGQLGLNGQLLTPQAGSRCRINLMTTDAPLVHDEPVDFGVEGVCDRCQICVRRCPVGAIPSIRKEHRGVVKAKINTKRCLPLMWQSSGCSICMKVCPVQRHGLSAVIEYYQQTGRILGKDSDDLEGYDWPLDGRHYGPGATPHVPHHLVSPRGFNFDPTRTEPFD